MRSCKFDGNSKFELLGSSILRRSTNQGISESEEWTYDVFFRTWFHCYRFLVLPVTSKNPEFHRISKFNVLWRRHLTAHRENVDRTCKTRSCLRFTVVRTLVFDRSWGAMASSKWVRATPTTHMVCHFRPLRDASRIVIYPTCIWRPRLEWPHRNFADIFCIVKLESKGYRAVLFATSNV